MYYSLINSMNKVAVPSYPSSLKLFIDALDGSYSGSGTTVIDKVGTQNGVMVNGVTWNATDGFVFDGTNDVITFAHNTAIKPTTSGTLAIMVKMLTPFTGVGISTMDRNTYFKGVAIYQDGSPFRAQLASNTARQSSAYLTRKDNIWCMLTITWDGTNVNRYLNDTLEATVSQTVAVTTHTNQISIGDMAISDYPMKGYVSWAKIYDTAISLSDVQANFNSIKTRHGL